MDIPNSRLLAMMIFLVICWWLIAFLAFVFATDAVAIFVGYVPTVSVQKPDLIYVEWVHIPIEGLLLL